MKNEPENAALALKELLIELSPLIEEFTAEICPQCGDVCCKQRRCVPDVQDIRYLAALGMPVPPYDAARPPDGPCQFMGPGGCVTPRWLRPWRCTWYICDPLYRAMNAGPQKKARRISAIARAILDIRSTW